MGVAEVDVDICFHAEPLVVGKFLAAIPGQRSVELVGQLPWAPRTLTNVIVRAGIVELWGTIFDEREREALRVAAENVPGVRQVKDHLVWGEPVSGMAIDAPNQE